MLKIIENKKKLVELIERERKKEEKNETSLQVNTSDLLEHEDAEELDGEDLFIVSESFKS